MSIRELYRATGSLVPLEPAHPSGVHPNPKPGSPSDFQRVLEGQAQGLKFSNHAEARIRSRSIEWNDQLEKRVCQGIESAQAKGSRETLILADHLAVIANVKSRTVITAMDANHLKERIFTNIDSAVIV